MWCGTFECEIEKRGVAFHCKFRQVRNPAGEKKLGSDPSNKNQPRNQLQQKDAASFKNKFILGKSLNFYLKECEFRWNFRKENLFDKMLWILKNF